MTLDFVPIDDLALNAQEFQLNKPSNSTKNMCVYCLTLSNLKPFNITHLFQGSVITFNPQCWSWIILNSPSQLLVVPSR
jgi:hypothetical protein